MVKGKKAMEINKADVAELVDARDLKPCGSTDNAGISCKTVRYEPGGNAADPLGLQNVAQGIADAIPAFRPDPPRDHSPGIIQVRKLRGQCWPLNGPMHPDPTKNGGAA